MDVLFKLTDEDIGYEYHELENPELRLAARGIVVRDDGKIAQLRVDVGNDQV